MLHLISYPRIYYRILLYSCMILSIGFSVGCIPFSPPRRSATTKRWIDADFHSSCVMSLMLLMYTYRTRSNLVRVQTSLFHVMERSPTHRMSFGLFFPTALQISSFAPAFTQELTFPSPAGPAGWLKDQLCCRDCQITAVQSDPRTAALTVGLPYFCGFGGQSLWKRGLVGAGGTLCCVCPVALGCQGQSHRQNIVTHVSLRCSSHDGLPVVPPLTYPAQLVTPGYLSQYLGEQSPLKSQGSKARAVFDRIPISISSFTTKPSFFSSNSVTFSLSKSTQRDPTHTV